MNIPGVKPRLHLAVLDVKRDVEIQRVVFGIWRACTAWRVLQIETQASSSRDADSSGAGGCSRSSGYARLRMSHLFGGSAGRPPDIEALLFGQLLLGSHFLLY